MTATTARPLTARRTAGVRLAATLTMGAASSLGFLATPVAVFLLLGAAMIGLDASSGGGIAAPASAVLVADGTVAAR